MSFGWKTNGETLCTQIWRMLSKLHVFLHNCWATGITTLLLQKSCKKNRLIARASMYFSSGNNFDRLDSLFAYRVLFDFFHGYQTARNVSWQALLTVRHKSQTWMTWNKFFWVATKDKNKKLIVNRELSRNRQEAMLEKVYSPRRVNLPAAGSEVTREFYKC